MIRASAALVTACPINSVASWRFSRSFEVLKFSTNLVTLIFRVLVRSENFRDAIQISSVYRASVSRFLAGFLVLYVVLVFSCTSLGTECDCYFIFQF
jgi:hypothetical protein